MTLKDLRDALVLLILVFSVRLLVACGDDRPPTYREAYRAYSTAWCENTAACAPGWYAAHYDSEGACVSDQVEGYCEGRDYCDDDYPAEGPYHRVLSACIEDQAWWPCGEWLGPVTCYEAFP